MKPLLILIATFVISLISTKVFLGDPAFSLSERIAMSAMLVFTAIGHFVFSKGMSHIIPDLVPFKLAIVYLTGMIELAAAGGLLVSRLQYLTAIMLILFFVAVLPANIHAAVKNIDYQTGTTTGNGTSYLWFRIPLQIFFIARVYFFAIH